MDNNQKAPESDELEQGAAPEPATEQAAAPATDAAGTPPADSTQASAPAPPATDKPPKPSLPNFIFGKKYLFIFILLIAIAGGGVFYIVQTTKKDIEQSPRSTTLTADELTALRGNTTIVGDPQTVLDIKSNSVFEGQVVMRSSLEVAGNVRIGTPLSLPALTVSGNSTLGQVAANGLSVSGSSTFQGDVNVQRNLSVAGAANFASSVSIQQLTVTNLNLVGDLLLPRHLSTSGGIPNRTTGPAVGTDGTTSVSGSDTAGTITLNTGANTTSGFLTTITFAQRFNRVPHVVITPVGSAAAGLNYYIVNRTNTGFTLATTNAPPINSNFSFDFIAIE